MGIVHAALAMGNPSSSPEHGMNHSAVSSRNIANPGDLEVDSNEVQVNQLLAFEAQCKRLVHEESVIHTYWPWDSIVMNPQSQSILRTEPPKTQKPAVSHIGKIHRRR